MKRPPLDVSAATKVSNSGRLSLRDVVVIGLTANHIATAPDGPVTLDWNVNEVVAIWELDAEELKAVFPMSIHIDAFNDDEPTARTRIAELSVAFRLDYRVTGVGDDDWLDALQDFVGVCGYLHLWPYFRSEVQWLTTKLGFPPLVLPLILSGDAANRVSVRNARELSKALSAPSDVTTKPRKRRAPKGV